MTKYSFEFKKKVVNEYLNGKGGIRYLAKQYNITSHENLRNRVAAYKEFGDEGLKRSRENKKYSFEFKLQVVELYLTTEVSYKDLAMSVGIKNPSMIAKWVNDYRSVGPEALHPKRKGREPQVTKPDKEQLLQNEKEKADEKYLEQLEEENLRFRYIVNNIRKEGIGEKLRPRELIPGSYMCIYN